MMDQLVTIQKKRCPRCQATIFHRAIYVSIVNGEEQEEYREYRCVVCNTLMNAGQMETFETLGSSLGPSMADAAHMGIPAIRTPSLPSFVTKDPESEEA